MIRSYSQLLEDVYVHQNFINRPRGDISMLEIGAYDGVTYSNTLMLERELECKPACLVEPSPAQVLNIRKNRPNSPLMQIAVSNSFGTAEFAGDSAISGIYDNFTEAYKKRWQIDDLNRYTVFTAPMAELQKVVGVDYIDFLSIDVQGCEKSILDTMNWDMPIGTICIELEGQHPALDDECRLILKNNGFQFKARLCISEIWTKTDYPRASLIYDQNSVKSLSEYELSAYTQAHLAKLIPYLA
jgi:FkbM family methyltransferase